MQGLRKILQIEWPKTIFLGEEWLNMLKTKSREIFGMVLITFWELKSL